MRARPAALAFLILALALVGLLLINDRPGLAEEFFALEWPWQGDPVYSTVGPPSLEEREEARDALVAPVGFGVRWSGWWDVGRAGEHRFELEANDLGYLRIGEELLVDTAGVFGDPIPSGHITLERGLQPIEIGLAQKDGESRLIVEWTGPGSAGTPEELDGETLYSGWPLTARRALRAALPSWPRPYRQLLGAVLLMLAVLAFRSTAAAGRLGRWMSDRSLLWRRPRWRAALLLGLFVLIFWITLPHTGSLRGGDDTAYLSAATFNTGNWFANRYGHVYLLKLFTRLAGGDPLAGVRIWWSFAFAATISALAVAASSIGPGLQLRTLAVALFLLVSQTTMMGLVGNGFADFSSMMFVTLAVAVFMHGALRDGPSRDGPSRDGPSRDGPSNHGLPRHEWHALAIGALTVAAMRSKEVGAILLLLLPLLSLVDGRLDLRRFLRRIGYWLAGALAAAFAVAILDGLIFGDFLLTLGRGRMGTLGQMNFPGGRAPRPGADWLDTIWFGRGASIDLSLRFLWLGVCVAALVAGIRRCRLERRLLHLLPIAYLAALVALYVQLPHPFSPRMLITILPVACLMTALVLHDAGLDDLPWRRLTAPGALLPAGLAIALLVFVLIPYRLGHLDAVDVLPEEPLRRFGWSPDHFMVGVLLPALVLTGVGLLSLGLGRRENRVAALVVFLVGLFGTGAAATRHSLDARHSVQVSDRLTYPWRVFAEDLATPGPQTVWLSRDLLTRHRMTAQTRSSLARLSLGRLDVWVKVTRAFPAGSDLAIASRRAWLRWREEVPPTLRRALEASARFDSLGLIVLLRPREAQQLAERLGGAEVADFADSRSPDLDARLEELAKTPDEEAGDRLLTEILATPSIALRSVQGARVLAAGLTADGWTLGTRPAGLLVTNADSAPRGQRLRLGLAAGGDVYPIRVFVQEGGRRRTVLFERPGRQEVELEPTAPGETRLVVVWSDRAWSPGGRDTRQLGVQVLAPEGPPDGPAPR